MALRTKTQWWGTVLDAPDAQKLGRFYERLLGWQVFDDSPAWVTLAPSKEAGYNLAFQKEEKYVRPVWPAAEGEPQMSMHLDIEVDDLEHAVAHAVEAGAELASTNPRRRCGSMLDPAGHPFCLYVSGED